MKKKTYFSFRQFLLISLAVSIFWIFYFTFEVLKIAPSDRSLYKAVGERLANSFILLAFGAPVWIGSIIVTNSAVQFSQLFNSHPLLFRKLIKPTLEIIFFNVILSLIFVFSTIFIFFIIGTLFLMLLGNLLLR